LRWSAAGPRQGASPEPTGASAREVAPMPVGIDGTRAGIHTRTHARTLASAHTHASAHGRTHTTHTHAHARIHTLARSHVRAHTHVNTRGREALASHPRLRVHGPTQGRCGARAVHPRASSNIGIDLWEGTQCDV